MSAKAIDYKVLLKRDGQTQQERMPAWLNPDLVPIDDRTKAQFFDYLKKVATRINFFDLDKTNNTIFVNGSWEDFFNQTNEELDALAEAASLPPHLALWQAFMQGYEQAQRQMNTITGRHLNFHYGEVLQSKKRPPVADKAHVLFELKKNAPNTLLKAGTTLLAGKDATKQDLHYALLHDIVVNASKVEELKALYVDPANRNYIHHAPVANSADGLGGDLNPANPKWMAFGNNTLPVAKLGFCLASDVLLMQEGDRSITVTLTLKNLPAAALNTNLTNNLFQVSLTGEKGWIGPKTVAVVFTSIDNTTYKAVFSCTLSSEEAPVVAYASAVHGSNFTTTMPLMQVLLNSKANFGYKELQAAEVQTASIEVAVSNVKSLKLQNDFGELDSTKPFLPFGATPDVNANFSLEYKEAFSKHLKQFSVNVDWKNVPEAKLQTYYLGYGMLNNRNEDFTAMASYHDASGWRGNKTVNLFNTANATSDVTWTFINDAGKITIARNLLPEVHTRFNTNPGWTTTQKLGNNLGHLVPSVSVLKPKVSAAKFVHELITLHIDWPIAPTVKGWINPDTSRRTGKLNLSLKHGFLFKEYRKKHTENILKFSTGADKTLNVINEPFAPEIQSIRFNYTATTGRVSFTNALLNSYVDEEIELFHYGAFGQMREHAYQRQQHEFLNSTVVRLLPEYKNEGEFYVGLNNLDAGDSACILFQVAEGSADPDKPKVAIGWSVLADNYWMDLTSDHLIFDTTNGLLTNGVIKFIIPTQATTINTILPNGLIWLRAAITADSNGVCQLLDVQSNAAVTSFQNRQNDPGHLAVPLAAKTIAKFEHDPGAVKAVKQPYTSFGGQMEEDNEAYYKRVSERLRHKQRSIALWDYERVLLQAFPKLHKVKCINHASEQSFYAPGHVLVILVPDLTNQNAVDPFQPKVDKNTVELVQQYLQQHSSAWVEHHVRNPFYEPVRIAVSVKLKRGFEFNNSQKVIDQKLQSFLSPWVSNAASGIHFGGKITHSMIVKFLEDMEEIEYLASLSLQHYTTGAGFSNKEVIEASNPAAILVSAPNHTITNYI